jgi:hypothetical protein
MAETTVKMREAMKTTIDVMPDDLLRAFWVVFEKLRDHVTPDDGSLAYLFKDYVDDGIREPIGEFGPPVGNEKW